MNELRLATWTMPCCGLGIESPFPPMVRQRKRPAFKEFDPGLPPEEYRHFGYGAEWNILPYATQNGYDRDRSPREFKTAVLENNRLRATFLLEFGGRLWSLFDKKLERELLNVNPVFQAGNLALRNAWFAGGIEWNLGWPGHFPYTFSPMHAVRVEGAPYPVLRMYEWERKRRTPYQIDFFLPGDDAAFLHSFVRIDNPTETVMPVYWWSNLAVDETPETRVIVPATKAVTEGGRVVSVPFCDNIDMSYPARNPGARDYFFHMEETPCRWEAAVDGTGRGMIYTSGHLLKGRKLFVWGQSQGGRHWQEYLAKPGATHYCEIQSGLGKTQLGCVPLVPGAAYRWMEAFGALEIEAAQAHGEWSAAIAAAAGELENMLPAARFDELEAEARNIAELPAGEALQDGSGWGALEDRLRVELGKPFFHTVSTRYSDRTCGPLQQPWLDLLAGKLPGEEAVNLASFMVEAEWQDLLHRAALTKRGAGNCWVNYQLALGAYEREQFALAHAYLDRCAATLPETQARIKRAKAMIYVLQEMDERALACWREAMIALPHQVELLWEAWPTFQKTGQAAEFCTYLPPDAATHRLGRIRQLATAAALETGDLATAAKILSVPYEIPEMAEGEASTSELFLTWKTKQLAQEEKVSWTPDYHAANRDRFYHDVPWWLDFRMGVYQPR